MNPYRVEQHHHEAKRRIAQSNKAKGVRLIRGEKVDILPGRGNKATFRVISKTTRPS